MTARFPLSRRACATAACVLAAGALMAAPAFAQAEQPPRPVHGLFGGPPRDPNTTQTFDANLSLFNAYDTDLLAQSLGPTPAPPVGGPYSGLNGGVTYSRTGKHVDFGLQAGSTYQYYQSAGQMTGSTDQGGVNFGLHGQRMSLQLSETVGYQPLYSFSPFVGATRPDPGTLAPISTDAALARRAAVMTGSTARFDRDLGPRTKVSADYSLQRMDYSDGSLRQQADSVGGSLSHHLSKDLALRLGYDYQTIRFSGTAAVAGPTSVDNIDAGVDFNKALGQTRKTTVGFTTGSAFFTTAGLRSFTMTGDAWLNREIGRTWAANANFHRGIGLLAGFGQPVLSDEASASLGGQVSHRLDLRTSAAYTRGDLNPGAASNSFRSYTASARLRFAMSAMAAVYGEYFAYEYRFDSVSDLPFAFTPNVFRQGVQAGLTLWLPLIR